MSRFLSLLMVLLLGACAGSAPVPGGTETVNSSYYSSQDDFKSRVGRLQAGMPEDLVFNILGRQATDLTRLSRSEVMEALYGANSMQLLDSHLEREETRAFLQSLYGYRLEFQDVKKSHGFASLIRMRTDEEGFKYSISLVFQNGILMEKPEIVGGVVHGSESRTFFDYLSPGTFMDRAR